MVNPPRGRGCPKGQVDGGVRGGRGNRKSIRCMKRPHNCMDEMQPEEQVVEGAKEQPKQKRRWARKHTVILIVALALAWFAGIQIMAAERYQAVVNVVEGTDKVGVNPTAERLDFGDLSRDTGASRFVALKNTGRRGKVIWVVKSGAIAELMKSNKPGRFTLAPGEEIKLEFNVKVPVSAPYQKFTGTVYIFKWPQLF